MEPATRRDIEHADCPGEIADARHSVGSRSDTYDDLFVVERRRALIGDVHDRFVDTQRKPRQRRSRRNIVRDRDDERWNCGRRRCLCMDERRATSARERHDRQTRKRA